MIGSIQGNRGTAAALLAAALLAQAMASGCSPKPGGGGFKPPPMPVETGTARVGPIADRFEAVGTIEGVNAVTVVSEIDGIVKALPFREGEMIAEGSPIATLDDGQLRAESDRAAAVRDQSRSTYLRVKSIVDQNAGSAEDLDNASSDLKVAEANLAVARARLAKAHIVAPFTGLVGARRVSVGTFMRAGSPITDLADSRTLKVTFSAPERFMSNLRRGSEVDISTPAFPGEALRGRVDVVEPMVDAVSRSTRLTAKVPNSGGRFRPGMSATVSAVLSQRNKAILIPSEAVFAEGDQSFVYAIKPDTTVARTAVTLGTRTASEVEVLSGLSAGTMVVRTGQQKLFDTARIIPLPPGGGMGGPGGPGGPAPAGGKPGAGKPGAAKAGK